jgi:hypothetical protein
MCISKGFKIELSPEEEAMDHARVAAANANADHAASAATESSRNGVVSSGDADTRDASATASTGGSASAGAVADAQKPPQQMQQQHAIQYVTTIRNRFSAEPDTYRCVSRGTPLRFLIFFKIYIFLGNS